MAAEPLLRVAGLSKSCPGGFRLRDISFTLERGATLAIAGRSGSGKTTLARCLARFETPDSGVIRIEGRDIAGVPRAAVQLIFQQPASSFNPRFTAAEVVAEPLIIQRQGNAGERRRRTAEAMAAVGLDPASAGHRALEFSGGERQRLAIARALVAQPRVLILDESLASLDLSVQAQIANLLLDLQHTRGIAYLLIAHDLTLVARMAGEIAILDAGAMVEHSPAADLLANPRHPVTRELVAANRALSGRA